MLPVFDSYNTNLQANWTEILTPLYDKHSKLTRSWRFISQHIDDHDHAHYRWYHDQVQYYEGYVYLFHLETTSYYKIGISKYPNSRLSQFAGYPTEISLVCTLFTNDMYRLEHLLHRRFVTKRARGEWFALSDDDVKQIIGLNEVHFAVEF